MNAPSSFFRRIVKGANVNGNDDDVHALGDAFSLPPRGYPFRRPCILSAVALAEVDHG